MLNKIFVMGRLTRDVELRQTPNGINTASFSIACERDFKDKTTGEKQVDYFDIVAWRQTADFVSRFFSKGRMAVIEGRLQIRTWQDKDGNNRRTAEIVADNVYFGDSKPSGEQQGSYQGTANYGGTAQNQAQDFEEIVDDDEGLPF